MQIVGIVKLSHNVPNEQAADQTGVLLPISRGLAK